MLTVRQFKSADAPRLWQLKYHTIRTVNTKDYSEAQVQAWAPDAQAPKEWSERAKAMNPLVAEFDGKVVGYADVQSDGYIDHFFCDAQRQGQGIGKALMLGLFEAGKAKGVTRFYSHVSITAKPFFAHFGFDVIKQQQVEIRGQILCNYIMERAVADLVIS
ncbi:MAG: GNAT family N-acetyltransferase [Psychrosphaera sp.]|nr:GNAT family N-acetyltransferase [Psychrosphaera sp.]